jgi:hypothetical protein
MVRTRRGEGAGGRGTTVAPGRFAVVLFRQKSQQHSHFRRQPRRTPVERIEHGGADAEILEYRKERAAAQFVDNRIDWEDGDTVAAQRGFADHPDAVGQHDRPDRRNPHRPVRPGESDVGQRQNVVVVRASVGEQFVWMARPAVMLEIIRGRNQQPPQRHDLLAHDPFAADIGRLNADVIAFLDRIVDAVVVVQLDEQIGMSQLEAANVPCKLMGKKGGNAADAQGACEPNSQRAHGRLRFFQLRNNPHAPLEIARARVRQRQPARGADQKLRLEPVLQLFHAFGDDGFG